MEQRGVVLVGEKDPLLVGVVLVAGLEQIRLLVERDLVGLLHAKAPGVVAAALDGGVLLAVLVVDKRAVAGDHRDVDVCLGAVITAGLDPRAVLARVDARDKNRAHIAGLEDYQRVGAEVGRVVDGGAKGAGEVDGASGSCDGNGARGEAELRVNCGAIAREAQLHAADIGVGGEDNVRDPTLIGGDGALGGASPIAEGGGNGAGGAVNGIPANALPAPSNGAKVLVLVLAERVVVRANGHVGVEETVDGKPLVARRVEADALLAPAKGAELIVLVLARGVVVVARIGVVETVDGGA